MLEKCLVTCAEVVEPRFSFGRFDEAILGALPVADREKSAFVTKLWQGVPFALPECPLLSRGHELDHWSFEDISHQMIWLDEVVAGIKIAVVLQGRALTARSSEDTDRSRLAKPACQRALEIEDEGTTDISLYPFVENRDQEMPPLVGPDGSVRGPVAFLVSAFVIPFHNWNELDVLRSKRIAEKVIGFQRTIGVFRIDRAQDVELHSVALQQAAGFQDAIESPTAAPVLTVEVVKFFGAIHAQADQKTVLTKEPAPLVVKHDAVGLKGVLNPGVGPGVLSLEFNGVLKKIETHEGRLAPLPCDGALRNMVNLEKLPYISLVYLL